MGAGSMRSSWGTVLSFAYLFLHVAIWTTRRLEALPLGMVALSVLGTTVGACLGFLPAFGVFLGLLETQWRPHMWSTKTGRGCHRKLALTLSTIKLYKQTYMLGKDCAEPQSKAAKEI